MLTLILSAILFISPAQAYDQRFQDEKHHVETELDKLPFKLFFDAPDSNFGGRSGKRGRPLRPNESMDFNPSRQPWDIGRDHGAYPGPKLGIAIPF